MYSSVGHLDKQKETVWFEKLDPVDCNLNLHE